MTSPKLGPGPLKLFDGIYLVGSGALGFSMSHPADCHVYLLHDGNDAVLIDAGCGLGSREVLASIEASGVPLSAVSRLLLTHAHADHAGGAYTLSSALNIPIFASERTAEILSTGDEAAAGLVTARNNGLYPREVVIRPTPCQSIAHGDLFQVGGLTITVLATPGHADGHMAYLVEGDSGRALLSGDLVFTRGRVVVLATPDTNVPALGASIRPLAQLGLDSLLPGHGSIAFRDAQTHIEAAIEALDRQELPEAFIP